MAVDFEDVKNAARAALDEAADAMETALRDNLYEVLDLVFSDLDDSDTAADAADYPVGDVGAEDEAEIDALRAAFVAGWDACRDAIEESVNAKRNI